MDDTGGMRFGDRIGDLRAVAEHVANGQRATGQQLAEGVPLDVLHDDHLRAFARSDLVDRDDVRMVQRRRGAGLAEEAAAARRVEPLPGQNLDRHQTAQRLVAGLVHLPHATFADLLEKVVVEQGSALHQTHAPSVRRY